MVYVRVKEVPPGSGNYYQYLVKGERDGGRVRQKVLQYLGKAEDSEDTSVDPSNVKEENKKYLPDLEIKD
ncbi:hypothetical protein C9439_02115 [archaeon SCG-AAA382B04]|nr:hypothetical protein C9439_02115 [archaeon SCG-AAA382B04]